MPATTIGGVIASILQFLAVMFILSAVINLHTVNGNGIIPSNDLIPITGLVTLENNTYVSNISSNSLVVQIRSIGQQSANSIATPSILQSIGGLAFIPAYFGQFMILLFNIPYSTVIIFTTLLSDPNITTLLTFSAMALSAILMAYYIIIFVMKAITPISKVEVEDV